MKYFFIVLYCIYFSAEAATWKKINPSVISIVPESTTCPSNYIGVPALYPYTTRFFCVMKYEAKKNAYNHPIADSDTAPWVSITRNTSRIKCKSLGPKYDLISNDQWQTIARNIAGVGSNWSGNAIASGELNRGHSDSSPSGGQVADPGDTAACLNTGQTCSSTVWNSQRRTHTLSNAQVIWDFGGNVAEWVTNNSEVNLGAGAFISLLPNDSFRQIKYGAEASTLCAAPATTPYCGMGMANSGFSSGTVARGGTYNDAVNSGVFAFRLDYTTSASNAFTGFRCVYVP